MSLLGRLEDLSLTDIVQIVYLSRRTGVLEIIDERGRHTVLFRQGLVVNASSPECPDLVTYFESTGAIPAGMAGTLRQMEESGIPYGTAAVEMNLISVQDLATAVRNRIASVVAPLLQSREGEFNFILSESVSPLDTEYDPEAVFKEGGMAPQKLLGGAEGEKIKPLRGLEESLKAGKALLRGSASAETTPASLHLGLGVPIAAPEPPTRLPGSGNGSSDNVVPFPTRDDVPPETFAPASLPDSLSGDESPFPDSSPETIPQQNLEEALPFDVSAPAGIAPAAPEPLALEPPLAFPEPIAGGAARTPTGRFKVSGGLFDVENPGASYRNVVLYEKNPLVRVAAKRAFGRKGVKIAQYGSLDDVRNEVADLVRANSFFVTFLELTEEDRETVNGPTVQLLQRLKKKNRNLPVVVVDKDADLRRRLDLLRAGADLYLTKPSAARLQPGLAEEELALFADELVLFAERHFAQWEQLAGGLDPHAGKRFYDLAQKESVDRSFGLLKQLINELSNPNDISQVSLTILRLSAEYLERGALFMVREGEFVGLGGFGSTGGGDEMDERVKRLRIARNTPSLLADVAIAGEVHRGKIRKTPANVDLIERLGGGLPTEVVALPIMHSGRPIGILYGDNAEHRAPIDNMSGLEIFLSQAGYAFGNAVFATEKGGRGREL